MNQRNRVELITMADGHKIVRLNGNNLHKVMGVQHDPETCSVSITLDADFMATKDDGTAAAELQEQREAEVLKTQAMLQAMYDEGHIVKFRPFDRGPMEPWSEAHRTANPHTFDFEANEYGLPTGRRS